ncbi:MAG: 16S rRNA processing protein RimM [Clostridiales bacterium]|nr:16S rRNA processing protein RimM [Clostridiales bacterium]
MYIIQGSMVSAHLAVGEILRPQGIRGEVKVRPLTNDPNRFWQLERAFFKRGDRMEQVSVSVSRVDGSGVYLTIGGVGDRDGAEKLRGELIYVSRADAVELPEDAEFICDLVGLRGRDDRGRDIGELAEVLQPGSADVYVFRGPLGEVLVPALKTVVLRVDIDAGEMLLSADRMDEVAVFDAD